MAAAISAAQVDLAQIVVVKRHRRNIPATLGVALGSVGQNRSRCGSWIFRLTNECGIVNLHADHPRRSSRDIEAVSGVLMHLNVLIVIDQK